MSAIVLIFLLGLTSVNAYIYGPDLFPIYNYYEADENLPIVYGPYPRTYLFNTEADNGVRFVHDDFNHYDEFIGYKDLDVFNINTGAVEVYRNENAQELDLSQLPEGYETFGGGHVYGYLPDGSIYRKHYGHDHPWDAQVDYNYNYGYNSYGFNYYTPYSAYRSKPVYTHGCQSNSACQYRYATAYSRY